jgi:hypothetical protein
MDNPVCPKRKGVEPPPSIKVSTQRADKVVDEAALEDLYASLRTLDIDIKAWPFGASAIWMPCSFSASQPSRSNARIS